MMAVAAIPVFAGTFLSKKIDNLEQNKFIRLDLSADELSIRDVQFRLPRPVGPKKMKLPGIYEAVVSVQNLGKSEKRVHLAIALFDKDGNLVGCGTTGSKLGSVKSGEEETFFVVFYYVTGHIKEASSFYITLESP